MEHKTDRLYPSAPFGIKIFDLEQRLEKNIKDVKSFDHSINNIKEMITNFQHKNNKTKQKYKKHKTITTILKSFDTFVIIATTSSSFTLSLTGIGLIATPISSSVARGLTISNKVIYDMIVNKYNKNKKQYERDHQAIKSFDELYRKSLQDNVTHENDYESLCKKFTTNVDETKSDSFL